MAHTIKITATAYHSRRFIDAPPRRLVGGLILLAGAGPFASEWPLFHPEALWGQERAMASEETLAPPPQDCTKCGKPSEWLTSLPRLGERPAYNIFRCITCSYVNWIAEKISD